MNKQIKGFIAAFAILLASNQAWGAQDCVIFLKDPRPQSPKAFQLHQLLHGESAPASLQSLQGLSAQQIRDEVQRQAAKRPLLIEDRGALEATTAALATLAMNHGDLITTYRTVLTTRFTSLGLDATTPQGQSIARIAMMMGLISKEEIEALESVYRSLPTAVQKTYETVLNRTGLTDAAVVLTYSREFFSSLFDDSLPPRSPQLVEKVSRSALTTLAPLFHDTDGKLNKLGWTGPFEIDADGLLRGARDPQFGLFVKDLRVEWFSDRVQLIPRKRIHLKRFQELESLKLIPGERIGVMPLQPRRDRTAALALAKMFKESGRTATMTSLFSAERFSTVIIVETGSVQLSRWSKGVLLRRLAQFLARLRCQTVLGAHILAGIDSTVDSEAALLALNAQFYWPRPQEIKEVLAVLKQEPMANSRWSQIWELSLNGYFGGPFILNDENPYQFVDEAMGRVFFTGLTPIAP
jgi:hypothetical protein